MKFSIRDMLLVTLIVALAVGWWVDHRRQSMATERLRNQLDDVTGPTYPSPESWARILKSRVPNSSAPAPNPPNE